MLIFFFLIYIFFFIILRKRRTNSTEIAIVEGINSSLKYVFFDISLFFYIKYCNCNSINHKNSKCRKK